MMRVAAIAFGVSLAGALASACSTAAPTPVVQPSTANTSIEDAWQELLAAEDARIATPQHLEILRTGLQSGNPFLRATAVRALGRSERPDLLPLIAPLLRDPSDSVRIAAAHAVGDATRRERAAEARSILLDVLPPPGTGSAAAGAVAESLGRLGTDAGSAAGTAARLTSFLAHDDVARIGALRGLYFLARQQAARAATGAAAADALRRLAVETSQSSDRHTHERTLAVATLALTRTADENTLMRTLDDPEPFVRREAAAAAGTLSDTSAVRRITSRAASDASGAVRYDALRVYAGRLAATHGCAPVVDRVGDTNAHVALLAIELLGTACRSPAHAALLDSLASSASNDGWHRAARGVTSLAAVDPGRARMRARELSDHESPFARAYAARAAALAADTTLMHQLAHDPHANVRTVAVAGLAATVGHAADSVYVMQLESDESELLMAVAAALEGSSFPGAADLLLDALDRVSALKRETSRDGRVALLDRVGELGDAALAPRVRRYLTDFDEVVADRTAAVLEAWTGSRPDVQPVPLPRLPLPTFAEASQLAQTAFVLEMADGGEVEMHLLPFDAPTNAARFARLSRNGYFDGLTLHRIVPNFVAQGGSPGANEYTGDGPFTRDELGVPNWRGTVGLSTRGRDTGDAQFYINLVDNVRLDHEYTVFAVVTRGMDVVDRLLEGAIIRRVTERAPR